MKIQLSLLALLLFLFAGCSSNESTPFDRYQEYQQRRYDKMALIVLNMKGTLRDESGKGLGGVTVTASSPRYEESSRTANDGFFSVHTKFAPDDTIDFRFKGQGIEWTETLRNIPKGTDELTLRFKLLKNGTVRLGALEY